MSHEVTHCGLNFYGDICPLCKEEGLYAKHMTQGEPVEETPEPAAAVEPVESTDGAEPTEVAPKKTRAAK